MARSRIKVSQIWQRNFAAPVALMRTAADAGHVLAVDDDAVLYLLDSGGSTVFSKQLPWMPAAAAVDRDALKVAVISAAGTLLVFDNRGVVLIDFHIAWRPTSLDISAGGETVAFVDGAGKLGLFDVAAMKVSYVDAAGPFYYVRFLSFGSGLFACGQYGEVLFMSGAEGPDWQKNYRCHTRLPAASAGGELLLIPSPYYGIIALRRDGTERGLFEVPEGPKTVAISADGETIFSVNEKNELIIFHAEGKILFRQPIGVGVSHIECDAEGSHITAVTTTGSLERFSVGRGAAQGETYLEFGIQRAKGAEVGPSVLWTAKVFSALGGPRGGQIALTPSARFTALLDIDGQVRVFDRTGRQAVQPDRMPGRSPALKAGRSNDLIVIASSDHLLALDLRSYRQRRLLVKNEWTTYFDLSPKGMFFAVADFFRGVSLFDETLDRAEYLETDSDVLGVAVDGNHHTMLELSAGAIEFYTDKGALMSRVVYPVSDITAFISLGQGFAVAANGRVDAFDSEGRKAWSTDVGEEIASIQSTVAGLIVSTAEGKTFVTNVHGTVIDKGLSHGVARYFAARGDPKEIVSIEYRGRLLTARSSKAGVLWRREMPDDILGMEMSPDGGYVGIIAGVNLLVLGTAVGEKAPEERLYLEI